LAGGISEFLSQARFQVRVLLASTRKAQKSAKLRAAVSPEIPLGVCLQATVSREGLIGFTTVPERGSGENLFCNSGCPFGKSFVGSPPVTSQLNSVSRHSVA